MKVAYVLFAKPPIHGFVKTRLANEVGPDTALELYKLMLKWHWETLAKLDHSSTHMVEHSDVKIRVQIKSKSFVFIAQPLDMKLKKAVKYFNFLPNVKKLKFREQSSGNLGERLSNAFLYLQKDFDFIIVWGSDIAALTHHNIQKSLEYRNSACILPASDGGYCLLGINSKLFCVDIFNQVSWSTKNTFNTQKKRFDNLGVPIVTMPRMPDLDTSRDIIRNITYMQRFSNEVYKKRLADLNVFWKNGNDS